MSSSIKVCVVGPSKKFLSGISYYTIRLSNALSGRYDTSVVCFRNLLPKFLFPGHKHVGQDLSNLEFAENVPVFDGMDWANPLTWYRARQFLRREKPDVVILEWWTSSAAHMHLLVCLMKPKRSRIVLEFHEVVDPLEESILPIRLYSRFMGRLLIRMADAYVTHSDSDRKLLAEKYRLGEERIRVIPHGLYDQYPRIDPAAARKQLSLGPEYVFMTFGLIRPYKGIPNLVRAFGSLPGEVAGRARLLIVGEIWEDRESVAEAIAACPHKDRIILLDKYVSDDEVSQYFSAADVVVLPYLRASQSGVAHIAMAFGKPILVSRVGGLEESMAEYQGTCFVPPGDVGAMAAALARLADEKPGLFEPPTRGWEEITGRYASIVESLQDKPKK